MSTSTKMQQPINEEMVDRTLAHLRSMMGPLHYKPGAFPRMRARLMASLPLNFAGFSSALERESNLECEPMQRGDLVAPINTGQPVMRIKDRASRVSVICVWYDDTGLLRTRKYKPKELKFVRDKEREQACDFISVHPPTQTGSAPAHVLAAFKKTSELVAAGGADENGRVPIPAEFFKDAMLAEPLRPGMPAYIGD